MKKFAALCFAVLLLSFAAGYVNPVAAASSDPVLLWDFGEDEQMSAVMGANSFNAVSYWGEKDEAGNDCYVFVAGSNDPYVSVDLSADDFSDIQWVKARVKNAGPASAVELFGHTNGRGLIGSECTHIDVADDGEWHTYIIYIPDENVRTVNTYKDPQYAVTSCYWEGSVDWIRLDPMWQEGDDGSDSGGSMRPGDEIRIDYIAFFPTEEAAKAFRSDEDGGPGGPGGSGASGKPASAGKDPAGSASGASGASGGSDQQADLPAGFASAEEAAAGRNIIGIGDLVFLSGTDGQGTDGPENLFDGDPATEFCTNVFPAEAAVRLNGVYSIVGYAMAGPMAGPMAGQGDGQGENGPDRPARWTISVSSDGQNWIELVSGDDSFFGETASAYYAGDAYVYGVSYVKLTADGAASGTLRLSELVLFGELLEPAAEEPEAKTDTGHDAPKAIGYVVTAVVSAAAGFLTGSAFGKRKRET